MNGTGVHKKTGVKYTWVIEVKINKGSIVRSSKKGSKNDVCRRVAN